jgi:LPS export ABC transporter protein LptC
MYSFKGPRNQFIATVFAVAMFVLGCEDTYKRVGDEAADKVFPQGVASDFTLRYTEVPEALTSQDSSDSRIVAVLKSPVSEDFTNLQFQYRTFPEGLRVEHFDEEGRMSTIEADYAIIYAQTNLIDLQGNVRMRTFDGKTLETEQLFWDRSSEWIFTEERFTLTNPEEGTVLNGEGMDFNRDFSYFNAHKTGGVLTPKDEDL